MSAILWDCMMCFNIKAIPAVNTYYSCHIKAVLFDLLYWAYTDYITPLVTY